MNLLKNGSMGARSKHIKIRFAWIKERLDAGDFYLEYKSTKEMLADGLTKSRVLRPVQTVKHPRSGNE